MHLHSTQTALYLVFPWGRGGAVPAAYLQPDDIRVLTRHRPRGAPLLGLVPCNSTNPSGNPRQGSRPERMDAVGAQHLPSSPFLLELFLHHHIASGTLLTRAPSRLPDYVLDEPALSFQLQMLKVQAHPLWSRPWRSHPIHGFRHMSWLLPPPIPLCPNSFTKSKHIY